MAGAAVGERKADARFSIVGELLLYFFVFCHPASICPIYKGSPA
jgi:hypothetical protein